MKRLLVVLAVCLLWAGTARGEIDVNSASSSELQMLKGVGAKTAANIIAARDAGGPFSSLENLAGRVKGIGSKTVAKWRSAGNVTCGKPRRQSPRAAATTPAETITLEKTQFIKDIAALLHKSGYKNYQVNIATAGQIADYLSKKAGVVFK